MKTFLKWAGIGLVALIVLRILVGGGTDQGTGSSQGSAVAKARPVDPPKQIYKTTAQQLFADYGANEVATDEKIKDKIVEVSGIVDSIDKSFTDSIIVTLRTSNQFMSAGMHVNDSEKQRAIVLKKGDRVVLQCEKMTRSLGSPVGSDCVFLPAKIKVK